MNKFNFSYTHVSHASRHRFEVQATDTIDAQKRGLSRLAKEKGREFMRGIIRLECKLIELGTGEQQ